MARAKDFISSGASVRRVCLVCGFRPTPGGGGTEKHVYELACGLLDRGIDVDIICEDRSFLPDTRNRLSDNIIGVDPDSLCAQGWVEQYREKSWRFAELLDPPRYDVVHSHSHYGYHTALKLTRLNPRPALVTSYHLTPLGMLERLRRLGFPEPDGAPIDRAVGVMEETLGHLSDRCIAVSCGVGREVSELYFVPAERVQVIYNWYDATVFRPRGFRESREKLTLQMDRPYLLYIGHFNELRGWILADAMRALPPDIALIVVHPERDPAIAEEFGDRVLFTGYVPPEQLALYYSAADLQCFPPVYGAFGLVLVEGMACGCPAVVFDFPAMNELVADESGYLVMEPTAAAYAAVVRRALEDGGAKRAAAIKRAKRFDMDRQIDAVVTLYNDVARPTSAGAPSRHQSVRQR